MTDSPDYRLFLNEKFSSIEAHINDKFGAMDIKLNSIEKQTTLTNSRVTHLEDDIGVVKGSIDEHAKECPAMPQIQSIKDNLIEYNWVKKHPKFTLTIVVIATVLLLTMGGFQVTDTLIENAKKRITVTFREKALNERNNLVPYDTLKK